MASPTRKRVDLGTFARKKKAGEPITMLTAYDFPTARLLDEAGVDSLLVGDSAGNVILGHKNTVPVTMDEMILLARSVVRGTQYALVIGDMPFMSYQTSQEEALRNAGRFLKEAGTDAVKLEGGKPVAGTVRAMVQSGIPVVGHLGLTPQSASSLGGYRVQGRTAATARVILEDALRLQEAGIFALVVEMIPDRLAGLLSRKLEIPVIGIGAGKDCDGQVLVIHDMLGIHQGFTPKFVRRFRELGAEIAAAAGEYNAAVADRSFPGPEHTFGMPDEEWAQLESFAEAL